MMKELGATKVLALGKATSADEYAQAIFNATDGILYYLSN